MPPYIPQAPLDTTESLALWPVLSSVNPPVHVPAAEDLGFQVTKFSSLKSTSDTYGSANIYQAKVFQTLCPTSLTVIHRIVY